ncbi:MAG: hypothetical protein Q9223_003949 [Gallowayella weberi]
MNEDDTGFSREDFASLLKHLEIPKSFIWSTNIGGWNHFIPSIRSLERTKYERLGFALSNRLSRDNTFPTLLSWSPQSCITSGLLFYRKGPFTQQFLSQIRRLGIQARLPMSLFLPLLATQISNTARDLAYGVDSLASADQSIGFTGAHVPELDHLPGDYVSLHQRLVQAMILLDRPNHILLDAITNDVASLFKELPLWTLWPTDPQLDIDMAELEVQLTMLRQTAHRLRDDSGFWMRRVDLHMKVQRDSITSQSIAVDSKKLAEASTRDSSSMKAIAVLTMAFLPSTAVATIFSMGPFWSNDSDSVFSVSRDFWLYWAIALPLTTVVLVVWQTWLWLYRRRQSRILKDIEDEPGKEPQAHRHVASSGPTHIAPHRHEALTMRRRINPQQ